MSRAGEIWTGTHPQRGRLCRRARTISGGWKSCSLPGPGSTLLASKDQEASFPLVSPQACETGAALGHPVGPEAQASGSRCKRACGSPPPLRPGPHPFPIRLLPPGPLRCLSKDGLRRWFERTNVLFHTRCPRAGPLRTRAAPLTGPRAAPPAPARCPRSAAPSTPR